jgi:hypothetical protein
MNIFTFKKISGLAASALLASITLFIAGCNGPVTEMVRDGIKSALPSVVGPADSWDVNVTGNPGTILGGRIPGIEIHGRNVKSSLSIDFDKLDVKAQDVHIDLKKRSLKSIDKLWFAGEMTQSELNSYMTATATHQKSRLDYLSTTLRQSDMQVAFQYKFEGIKIPISVTGRLKVSAKGDDKIDFEPSAASIAIVPLPKKLLELAMSKLNPVVDLSSNSFPVHLTDIKVDAHRLIFSGKAEMPASAVKAMQDQLSNAK